MKAAFMLILTALALAVAAADLEVLRPANVVVRDGGELALGTVGPGQTLSIEANALVETGGIYGIGGRWDKLEVVETPEGWDSEDSYLYEQPLKTRITVARNAPDGEYIVMVRAVDIQNKEELGEVRLMLKVNVSKEVFGMKVEPKGKETGAAQPATYMITLYNDGVASDAFEISASGLPAWEFRKTVFVPYGSSRQVPFDLVAGEDGEYDVKINVRSLSSERIGGEEGIHLSVRTSLVSDYKAVNNGLLIFPIFEQAAYSVMGLLANLF